MLRVKKNPLTTRKYRPSIETTKLVIYEKPDLKACENVWTHPILTDDHRKRSLVYCDLAMNNEDNVVKVEYERKKFGRFKTLNQNKMVTCTTMWNRIRSVLFESTETDIDIINAHPNILRYLIKNCSKPMSCEHLDNYCNNRMKIFTDCEIDQEAIDDFNEKNKDMQTKYDILKKLSTMVLYGSVWKKLGKCCPAWEEEYEFTSDDYTLSDDLINYFNELQDIRSEFTCLPEYDEIISYSREQCFEKNVNYHSGKGLSLILQEEETRIILKAIKLAIKNKFYITAYTYDGFQVLKNDAIEDLIVDLNKLYDGIDFMVKPFKKGLDLSQLTDPTKFDIGVFDMHDNYDSKKRYFEKYHFKVKNPVSYFEERRNYCSDVPQAEFERRYEDLQYYYEDKKGETKQSDFMKQWKKDSSKRVYDTAVFMPPPRGDELPKDVYNKWTGFPIENEPLDESVNITRLLYHIVVVANFNYATYNWFLDWMASIIQNPSRKTEVCPVLIGSQGCGKSTLAERYLSNMIGDEKTLITSEPAKFTGRFTDLEGKLIVALNEAEGSNLSEVTSVIKDRITSATFPREKKGMQIEEAKPCFVNLIYTSNQIYFKLEKGERRFMPVICSDQYKNNKAYFDLLYRDFADKTKMRKFYQYLKDRDISKVHLANDRPWTEIRMSLSNMCLPYDDKFMIYILENWDEVRSDAWNIEEGIMEWSEEDTLKMTASCFNKIFVKWWKQVERLKEASLPSSSAFGIKMGLIACVRKDRHSSGNKYTIKRNWLELYVNCIEKVDSVSPDMEVWTIEDLNSRSSDNGSPPSSLLVSK